LLAKAIKGEERIQDVIFGRFSFGITEMNIERRYRPNSLGLDLLAVKEWANGFGSRSSRRKGQIKFIEERPEVKVGGGRRGEEARGS